MKKEYDIPDFLEVYYLDSNIPTYHKFREFLGKIPQISLSAFLTKLTFVNYCLHTEKLSIHDFLPYETTGDIPAEYRKKYE